MYSVTITCTDAAHLGAVAKHLETLDIPAFVRSEVSKPKAQAAAAPETVEAPKAAKAKVEKAAKPKVEEPAEEGVTYDQVKEATFKLAGLPGDGSKLVKEVLAQFGVDHATKLTDKQWKAYVDAAAKKFDENKPEENLA